MRRASGLLACVLLGFAGCRDCRSAAPLTVQAAPLNYYDLESHVTFVEGDARLDWFGQDSWASEGAGTVNLAPQSALRIAVPEGFPLSGALLEMQFDYTLGNDADFRLEAENRDLIAEADLRGDGNGGSQTFTLLVDMTPYSDSTFVKLTNTSSTDVLIVNANFALFSIEAPNSAGIHVADLRPGSERVDASATTAGSGAWLRGLPDDFWGGGYTRGDVVFDISDIVSGMARPVAEFNFAREEDASGRIELHDENDILIGAYESDGDCCEDTGHTFLVDLTEFRNSAKFRLYLNDMLVEPFVKIQDAADTSRTSVLLDIAPGGRDFVSDGWKFGAYDSPADDYPTPNGWFGGMSGTTISYEAKHWMADPTHAPYGQEGRLVIGLPSIVAGYSNAVLGVVHFAPDADPALADPEVPGDPGLYPLEFYVASDLGSDLAHVRFDPWDRSIGGILRNHIPLGAYGVGSTLTLRVPAETDRWSLAAFPVFLRVFDAARGTGGLVD